MIAQFDRGSKFIELAERTVDSAATIRAWSNWLKSILRTRSPG